MGSRRKRKPSPSPEPSDVELEVMETFDRLLNRNLAKGMDADAAVPTMNEVGKACKRKRSGHSVLLAMRRCAEKGFMARPVPWRITPKGREWIE